MNDDIQKKYNERLNRYVTAMRRGTPDMVPIRAFAAEFVGPVAGFNNQQLTNDYENIFEATLKCAKDFDWDATAGNLVYNWMGYIKTIGWKYFAFPGIELDENGTAQYLEPEDEDALMRTVEYDEMAEDPTAFLFNKWLPRFTHHINPPGEKVTFEHNMALLNGGMSLMAYNNANAAQCVRLKNEAGTVPAISGLLKAPLDIIGDKLRGYMGLLTDLYEQPKKVEQLCEALMPHIVDFALAGADPDKNVPITIFMHRGGVPFVMPEHFNNIYWPTLKPIIEEIWSRGHQVLFYAEGNWDYHLESFKELPEGSIIYHADQGDPFKAKEVLGDKFCISGGMPNVLLSYGSNQEIREYTKRLCTEVGRDGGYIMDASAIMQDDSKASSMKVMIEATREFGSYSRGHGLTPVTPDDSSPINKLRTKEGQSRKPGVCFPWEQASSYWKGVQADTSLVKRIWESQDAMGYYFMWQNFLW